MLDPQRASLHFSRGCPCSSESSFVATLLSLQPAELRSKLSLERACSCSLKSVFVLLGAGLAVLLSLMFFKLCSKSKESMFLLSVSTLLGAGLCGCAAEPFDVQAVLQILRQYISHLKEVICPFESRCGGAAEPAVLQAALQIFHGPHGTHTRRSGCTEGQGALGGQPVCRRA
eukprot:scaffold13575_cov16-Tisochrysis_lutea.AAC.2